MANERPMNVFDEYEQEQAATGFVVPERLPQGSFDGSTETTFGEAIGAAVETGLTRTIGDWIGERQARYDGNKIDAAAAIKDSPNLSNRFEQLPEEYREKLLEAETDEQLETMLYNAETQLHYQRVLENAGGVTSFGAQIAAGLLDPTEWAIGLATGGLGSLAMKGRTVGKGARMLVTGLEAGTASAAVTAGLAVQNPTIDWDDVAAAFVVGAAIGAPFGAVGRGDAQRLSDAAGKYARTTVLKDVPPAPYDRRAYMRKNRAAESSGSDVAAATTSSAYGRYQFLKDTWVSYYKKTFGNTGETREQILAKRADGSVQDRVMETFTVENEFKLKQNGIAVNDTSLYLMHFLGERDALKVLKAPPGADVSKYVRAASRKANSTVFTKGMTVQGLVDWAARKMGSSSMTPGGSAAEIAEEAGQAVAASFAREEARFAAEADDAIEEFTSLGSFQEIRQSVGAAAKGVEDVEYFGASVTVPGSYARYLGNKVPADIRQTFGSIMNSLSRKDNNTREIAAETTARRIHDGWLSQAYMAYNPHFREWSKGKGYGIVRQELGSEPQQEFMREVTRAMRGDINVSPQAKAAGDALAEGYKKALMEAKAARLPGFEDINPNEKYVPRLINERKLMSIHREVGMDGLRAIIKKSLMGAGMSDELANRVAKAYAEGSVDRAISPTRRGTVRGLAEDDIERLRYYLPEDDPSLVDDVIASLKNFRETRNPDGGRIDRAKYRLDMDELSETVINGKTYRVTDLFEDDAWQIFEKYGRTVSGWIGLAERANVRSDSEWDLLVKGLKDANANDPKIKEYLSRLEEVKELTLGRSIVSENGTLRRSAQVVRKLNFASTMGQAGMASFAELGNVVAYGGMKNLMMHLPLFRRFWTDAKAGVVDKAMVEELKAIGIGMKLQLGRGRAGVDEFGDAIENHVFDTVDRILDPFSRAVSHVGLLGPMNDFLQMLSARSFVQKLGNASMGRHKFTQGEIYRLRDAGFHDGVLERVQENIRQHGVFDGKRLVGLGIDKWDRDIAMDFKDVLANMTYRAVQENDIGSSAWWMHTGLGRMLMQFRSFVFNALVKQSIYGARFSFADGRPDAQVFSAFALTMFFGGMSYVGRSYINSIGRDDQEEYLEKRVGSVENVAAGAFNATGYASILPGVIDTGLWFTGASDPLFAYTRTSGLASDFITGNPTVRTAENLVGAARSIVRTPQGDYDFSKEDLRRWQALTPLGNVTGIRNGFAIIAQDLPDQSQEDEYWQ